MTLLAAYAFDEGTGTTAADATGNGHTLTLSSASWTSSGHTNSAITNTASSSVGASGTVPAVTTAAVTLMAWVKPLDLTSGSTHFACGVVESNGNSDIVLWTQRGDFGTSNVLQANVRISGNLTACNGSALTVGTWYHVAVTYDGSNIRLYLNGSLVTTVANTGSLSLGTTLYVAGANASAAVDTDVVVDDVRYYSEVLDATAVTTAMNTPVSGSTTTVNATASLSETATLSAAATPTYFSSSALSESVTLSASVGSTVAATAALSESATLTSAATLVKTPSASLSESSTVTASAKVTALPSAQLVETATLAASPKATYFVNTSLSETSSFTGDLGQTTPPPTPVTPYIPPTPPNTAAVDEWRAFIFETVSGTYETELPLAAIPTYQYTLNDAGSGSVQVALGGTDGFDKNLLNQYSDNEDWRWSIAVVYNNSILQAGPILSESYSEGTTTSLSFAGIWKLFSKRVIINPSVDISTPTLPAANSTYSSVTLNQLAKLLVQDNMLSQGALPIDLPADDMPGTNSQTYYGYDLNLVADELANLTKLDQGPEIEFRPYWVDPLHVRWTMRIGAPRLGQLGSAWVYDYGEQGALVGVDRTSDSSNNISASYSRGAGSQAAQVIGYSESTSAADADLLLLAVDGNHTSETSQSKLNSYAKANVSTYQGPVVTYALTVKMNATDINKNPTSAPTIDQLSLGDTLKAVVTNHHRLTDGVYTVRVVSIQNSDAQTAKLTTQTTTS